MLKRILQAAILTFLLNLMMTLSSPSKVYIPSISQHQSVQQL